MKMGRRVLWGCVAVVLLCLILVGGGFIAARSIPIVSEQIPPGYFPVHVYIVNPANQTEWPLNSYVPIQVTSRSSQPIAQMELYINGVLYETQSPPEGLVTGEFAAAWNWQPATPGTFTLVARAVGTGGEVGISNLVLVTATDAAITVSPVTIEAGDTLQTIAEEYGVEPEAIASANPDVNMEAALEPGAQIRIPNLPAPLRNLHVIPGFNLTGGNQPGSQGQAPADSPVTEDSSTLGSPPVQESTPAGGPPAVVTPLTGPSPTPEADDPTKEPGSQPPAPPEDSSTGIFSPTLVQDAKLLFDRVTQNFPQQPPAAPQLVGDFKGCDVHLRMNGWFYDPTDPLAVRMNEDGFFVYRSKDGKPFERIATIPPIHDFQDDDLREFTDPNQFGTITYTVASFNLLGESPSNPVTIPLKAANCQGPAQAGSSEIRLEDGDLILPYAMDMAYLYIRIDGSQGVRVPAGDRTFLPGSGVRFNLDAYLDSLVDTLQAPDLEIDMEVWGWLNGKLTHAGDYHTSVHRSILTICSVEGEGGCTGSGGGSWVGELNLTSSKPVKDQVYEVRWITTDLSSTGGNYFQLSAAPFFSPGYADTLDLLYARVMDAKGEEGVFTLPLGGLLFPDPPNPSSELGWGPPSRLFDFTSNGFLDRYPPDQPFTLYLRFTPRLKMSGLTRVSNVVGIHYNTALLPSDLPPLASPYSSLYEVEILEDTYKAPDFLMKENWGCVVVEEDPTGQYAPGQVVCPGKIVHTQDCGDWDLLCLVEGFGESLAELGNYVIFGINTYKGEIVSGVAHVIPGCSESPKCVAAVQKGVDYGVSALTGLPPDLPNFEELASQSITSFIVTNVAGIDDPMLDFVCDADCQGEIGTELMSKLKQGKSLQSQKACLYGYEAYFYGQQPACLDPSIIVHPAPGSGNYPAFVAIRVTRKTTSESLAVTEADQERYRLDVTVIGEAYSDAYQQNLIGPLYQPVRVAIPWLQPGESVIIPVVLEQNRDPVEGNAKDSGSSASVTTEMLYFDGTTSIRATEECYSAGSSWEWVPCSNGGGDQWDFANPASFSSVVDQAVEEITAP